MVGSDIRDAQIERLQNYYLEKGRHPREVAQDIPKAVMQKPAYIPGHWQGLQRDEGQALPFPSSSGLAGLICLVCMSSICSGKGSVASWVSLLGHTDNEIGNRQRIAPMILFADQVVFWPGFFMAFETIAAKFIDDIGSAFYFDFAPFFRYFQLEKLPVVCFRVPSRMVFYHHFGGNKLDDGACGIRAAFRCIGGDSNGIFQFAFS